MSGTGKRHRFLVTGGAGFIGSNLVHALAGMGHSVRVLDDFTSGDRANLDGVPGPLEVMVGDIREPAVCRAASAGIEYVLHHAAVASVPASVADPAGTDKVNTGGCLNLLLAAREAGVRRFVFAGSSAVYGDDPVVPKEERLPPAPGSPYAVQKLSAEGYCLLFRSLYGLKTTVFRYFNVYGPRQDPRSQYAAVVPIFISRMLAGRPVTIYGDGRQTRDFVFVGDVVAANLAACLGPDPGGGPFNLGRGRGVSLLELRENVAGITGWTGATEFEPARPGDVRDSRCDPGRLRSAFGALPETELATGLERTVAWYRERLHGRKDP